MIRLLLPPLARCTGGRRLAAGASRPGAVLVKLSEMEPRLLRFAPANVRSRTAESIVYFHGCQR